MLSFRRTSKLTALAGAVLCSSALTLAQQPQKPQAQNPARRANPPAQADQSQNPAQPGQARQERRPGAAAESETATHHASTDSSLAACLIIDNHMEISMARMAQEHAQHEKVKAFAEKMVKDHEQFVQQLQETATQGGYTDQKLSLEGQAGESRQPGADTARRDNSAESRTDGAAERRAARPAELENNADQGVDFISLKREVAQLCLQSAEQEMSKGEDFDKHYMGMQLMAHQGMVNTLTVFEQHASPELKETLQKGLETAQAHLDEAREIMKELKGAADGEQRERATNN